MAIQTGNIFNRVGSFFARVGIGFVLILLWGWAYLRTQDFFPVDTAGWRLYITTWVIFFGFILTISLTIAEKYVGKVFRFPILKDLPKFFISAIVSGIIYTIFIFLVKGSLSVEYVVPLSIIFVYALFVALPEEIIFRGIIPNYLRTKIKTKLVVYLIQAVIFAAFHFALGRSWTTLLFYIPLGLLWMWIKDKYSPVTNLANAGSHFSWDIILLIFGIA
jgi:membrane protease YdiL (CAAX protease family)